MAYTGRWTVFDLAGSPALVAGVVLFGFLACLGVLVRPTRSIGAAGVIALFVLVASLNARAPYALSSAEMYLAVLLFWASISTIGPSPTVFVRAVRLQVALVYAIPLLVRFFHGGQTWLEGSAVGLVVANPDVARGPLAPLLRTMPDAVLHLATWGVLIVEVAVALSLVAIAVASSRIPIWIPVWLPRLVLVAGVGLHAVIALVCGLWFFSAVAIVGLVASLKGEYDWPHRRWASSLVIVVVACVACWNVLSVAESPALAASRQRNVAAYVVRSAGITQVWGVFSPNPPRQQRWVEIVDENGLTMFDSRRASDRVRKLAQNSVARPRGALSVAWLGWKCRSAVTAERLTLLLAERISAQRVELVTVEC